MGFGPRFDIPHEVQGRPATVVMRPAQEGDAKEMVRLLGDSAVRQFTLRRGGVTLRDEEELLEKARTSADQVLWMISVQYEDQPEVLVGTTSLNKHRGNRFTSFILLANRAMWGQGIATVAHRFRTWYAFCELGAHALNSSYIEDNPRSGRALKSVGYVEVGRIWKSHLTDGRWRDEVLLVCHNPMSLSLLWPDDDPPEPVMVATRKTIAAFEHVRKVLLLQ